MNNSYYHFIADKLFTIGRDQTNSLSIPCKMLSGLHCTFNMEENKLVDIGSSNGTFVNRDPSPVSSAKLNNIDELNIAGTFTFKMTNYSNSFVIKLRNILKDKICNNCSHTRMCEELYHHYYIFPYGDAEICIKKQSGEITDEIEAQNDSCLIEIKNGKYYFTDQQKNVENQLIRTKNNVLPVNIKVTLLSNT